MATTANIASPTRVKRDSVEIGVDVSMPGVLTTWTVSVSANGEARAVQVIGDAREDVLDSRSHDYRRATTAAIFAALEHLAALHVRTMVEREA